MDTENENEHTDEDQRDTEPAIGRPAGIPDGIPDKPVTLDDDDEEPKPS